MPCFVFAFLVSRVEVQSEGSGVLFTTRRGKVSVQVSSERFWVKM
jgi:hypothetical protein